MDELSDPTDLRQAEVLERTGITYRQLDYWTRSGWVHPIGGRGSGHNRAWPLSEVDAIGRMVRLVDAGLLPSRAAMPAHLDPGSVVIMSSGVAVVTDWQAFLEHPRRNAANATRWEPYGDGR